MSNLILREQQGRVLLLTLNRPDKLNALNYAMNDALLAVLDEVRQDDSVGVIILTGAGERAFSAGGDIHEFTATIKTDADLAVREFVQRGQAMTARLEFFPKPIIVAVNGLAFGGGCEITEAAHLAIAVEDARFAKPEINIGIPPTFGGTQRLPRLAGRKRALELLLTGDEFSAGRAYEIGLVNAVVPKDQLLAAAFAMAERILRHSPVAAARIITAVTRGLNTSIKDGLNIEKEQFALMTQSEDIFEGLNAWIERRKPHYSGR